MKNTWSWKVLVSGLMLTGVLAGCSDANGPSDDMTLLEASNALTTVNSGVTSLAEDGVVLDGTKGLFSLGWQERFNPRTQTTTLVGNATAVGIGEIDTTVRPILRSSIDLGTVTLAYSGNQVELKKHTSPHGGVAYTLRSRPKDESTIDLDFIPNTAYEFSATGSDAFSAATISLTTPSALLDITSPAQGQVINASNDLTLVWTGGSQSTGVAIVLGPARGPKGGDEIGIRGPRDGNGHGVRGGQGNHQGPGGPGPGEELEMERHIVIKLETNPGTYTIPSATLQEVVSKSERRFIVCGVTQWNTATEDHDGGKIQAVHRDGARVLLKAE